MMIIILQKGAAIKQREEYQFRRSSQKSGAETEAFQHDRVPTSYQDVQAQHGGGSGRRSCLYHVSTGHHEPPGNS